MPRFPRDRVVWSVFGANMLLQGWLLIAAVQLPFGRHLATEFSKVVLINILAAIAWRRHVRSAKHMQKRLVAYGFGIFAMRFYASLFSGLSADVMSLAVVWCLIRSQTGVLRTPVAVQHLIDGGFFASVAGYMVLSQTGQSGMYTAVFTTSHLIYVALALALYVRTIIISADVIVQARFGFMVLGAAAYLGLFLWDYNLRVAESHTLVMTLIKNGIEIFGLTALYTAFNMSESLQEWILSLYYRLRSHDILEGILSLSLHLDEGIATKTDHVISVYARRVAERLDLDEHTIALTSEAAALVARMNEKRIPHITARAAQPAMADDGTPGTPSIEEEEPHASFYRRVGTLSELSIIVENHTLPYYALGRKHRIESTIVRAVRDYFLNDDLPHIIDQSGIAYHPRVVQALEAVIHEETANIYGTSATKAVAENS